MGTAGPQETHRKTGESGHHPNLSGLNTSGRTGRRTECMQESLVRAEIAPTRMEVLERDTENKGVVSALGLKLQISLGNFRQH